MRLLCTHNLYPDFFSEIVFSGAVISLSGTAIIVPPNLEKASYLFPSSVDRFVLSVKYEKRSIKFVEFLSAYQFVCFVLFIIGSLYKLCFLKNT